MLEGYLASYPELGNHLAIVIEKLFYFTKAGTPEGDAVDAWVGTNYSKVPSNVRKPVIYGVLYRAEKSPHGMPLLRAVIAAETPEENLMTFLSELPRSPLPMEGRLELLTPVAQRIDEKNPGYESMLTAIVYSMNEAYGRFLAETVAKDPTRWSPTLVEYSNSVRVGEKPFNAAQAISMREILKRRP